MRAVRLATVVLAGVLLATSGLLGACKRAEDETGLEQGELLGIGLSPNDPRLTVDESLQFQAKAFYDNQTSENITSLVDWTSTDTRVASITPGGLCTAHEIGETSVIATYQQGVSSKVTVTVTGASVISVVLHPPEIEMYAGGHVQMVANALYSDGTEGNVAGSCDWTSDDPGIASVDEVGGVDGLRPGTTTVRATYGDMGFDGVPVEVVEEQVVLPEPDLRVTWLEGWASGSSVIYEVEAENRGDGYAGEFYIHAVLDAASEPAPEDDFDGLGWVAGLVAGETWLGWIEVEDVGPGTYDSWVLVDPDDWVEESDERNNAEGPVEVEVEDIYSPADLAITTFEGLTDGYYTLYYIEVTNLGLTASSSCWLDLYYDSLDEPVPPSTGDVWVSVPELDPGESHVWEPDVEDGPWYGYYDSWYSWVLVDSLDTVAEGDEGNNTEWIEVVP